MNDRNATEGLDLDEVLGPACPECGYHIGHRPLIPTLGAPACSQLSPPSDEPGTAQ